MSNPVFKNLSLGFLSDQIGIKEYKLLKNTYLHIAEDGHLKKNINDKELAASFFENSISDKFFENRNNFNSFRKALPAYIVDKIVTDLDQNIDSLQWNVDVSEFFVNNLSIPEKFLKRKESESFELSNFEIFDEPDITFKKLKDYQAQIYYDVYSYISNVPFARCIIQMPTGSGKTRTAIELVCDFINETDQDVLWLANTEELCGQAFGAFNEIWNFLKKKQAQSVNHVNFKGELKKNIQTFHVYTLQSFNTKKSAADKIDRILNEGNGLGLIIVDEAHISVAPTYQRTIKSLISKGAKLVGLTATPGRHIKQSEFKEDKNDENTKLSEFYFNKIFQIDTGNKAPIDFLREKGILSNAKFISLEGSTIENMLSPNEIKLLRKSKTIPKKIEDILTNDYRRNAIIFDNLIRLLNEGKKVLFFGTSLQHSKLIATLINLKGIKAAHVDGNSGKYRGQIIDSFRNGNVRLLCNYGVLSTGFDDPQIDVVFMARPTNSIVLYSQIIGRGLRGPLIGGTDTCEIYTVFDNILDMPTNNEIYSYFDEYFV